MWDWTKMGVSDKKEDKECLLQIHQMSLKKERANHDYPIKSWFDAISKLNYIS